MTESKPMGVPVYQEYMDPILDVLRREGRPLHVEQLDRRVIEAMKLPPAIATIPHQVDKPDRSEVSYRIAWSRTYLKKAGLLANPTRGQWAVTEKGRDAHSFDAYAVASEIGQAVKAAAASNEANDDVEEDEELLTARVGEELARQLRATYEQLAADGQLITSERAERVCRRFREVFGPDVLSGLDGEALLTKMHARGTKDSLVYWLEFKDDEELPGRFGSIAGGSALKFGIYQATETGQWMTGTPAQQTRLTTDQAITLARTQRDQLIAGANVLAGLPADTEAIDFVALQNAMTKAAPDLAETSWGHKYFAMLYPSAIEPFHSDKYQQHQLRKLLKLPGQGRYENARIFVGVARQLDMPLVDLATVLYQRNGGPHGYWRVGTTIDDKSEWDSMRTGVFAAIGWPAIGDLASLTTDPSGKEKLRAFLLQHYPGEASTITRATNQIFQFAALALEGDIVVAMEGARVRGIGRITGRYSFVSSDPRPHRRRVDWLRTGDWKFPRLEGMRTTFVPIRKDVNIIEIEARLLAPAKRVAEPMPDTEPKGLPPLTGLVARIDAVLARKRQVILYGPPGTGKTFWAERAVEELAARAWLGTSAIDLDADTREQLRRSGAIEVCSFHPAYGYEDFLEGFRPVEKGGSLAFELRDGVFKKLCARADRAPTKPHFLIIDEINRGDIPRIFGELLTVLEREKRGRSITLPLSATSFAVPDNVFVVGTMNTADRSIALLDAALRRRFGFVELLPDTTTLAGVAVGGLPLGPWLEALNRRVVEHAGRDARHLQIGHSYLLPGGVAVREVSRFAEILRDDIVPLLEEYCYEDFEALERILGKTLVQRAKSRIDSTLFEPARHTELIQALLLAFEEITATKQAVEADAPPVVLDDDETETHPDQ